MQTVIGQLIHFDFNAKEIHVLKTAVEIMYISALSMLLLNGNRCISDFPVG